MKYTHTRIAKVFLTVTFIFLFGNQGLTQRALAQQDSTQRPATSKGTIEIVSSHDGLDVNQYMSEIFQRLNAQHALQPRDSHGATPGKLVVEFAILRDGTVDYTKVIKSTVDQITSQSEMDAIRSAAPFPLLPKEFKGKSLKVRLHSEFLKKPEPSINH